MKTIIKNISLLLCVVATLASCERKPLYDDCVCTNTLSIPIDIDWETSGITPKNVSVLFYDSDNGELITEHIFEHNSNTIQSYAKLSEGSYTAVIFNELRNQIDYMTCVGHENISTLKFEGNDDDPLRSRAETRSYIKQSGDLAVATVENIVVTKDMIVEASYASQGNDGTKSSNVSAETKSTIESLTGVIPQKKNSTITITAHIKNLYYARMPALVDLVNLADGYYVNGDKNSSSTATLQFTMNNRTYDAGSYFDGTISTTITTFGTLIDRSSTSEHDETTPITLDILFKLIDAEPSSEVSLDMDVTSFITHSKQNDGSYLLETNVSFDEKLPAVEPDGSDGDSGFTTDSEDWNDVDVPLQQ